MKAIVFDRFGDPAEVLELRDVPEPVPGPGEVRVRMLASPVNRSDLLLVRGEYGRLPALPCTPGFEGSGVVEAAGPGLLGWLRRGRRVAVLNSNGGTWQEKVVVPAKHVVPIGTLSDEQAAMFFVNPLSALVMVRWVLRVPPGAWLLQTAAGSALGRMVLRLGRHDGFRTINVVRRREQAEELRQLGGDATICTAEESIVEHVQALTQGAGVLYALDAVGGNTGLEVVRALGSHGRLVFYGTFSGEPVPIDPRLLMVGQKRLEGFWMSEWSRGQSVLTMLRVIRTARKLLAAGVLVSDVSASFPLADIQAAVRQAVEPGHSGKVLLRISSGW